MRSSVIVAAGSLLAVAAAQNSSLPVVDLGYELYQATTYNTTGAYYNFTNIRYAAPPTGENRFRAPLAPASNRSAVQTYTGDRICPQAAPMWELVAATAVPEELKGQYVFNASSFSLTQVPGVLEVLEGTVVPTLAELNALNFTDTLLGALASTIDNPSITEDCLFLDVVVPEAIFEGANKTNSTGAPVMVWIYGGGYIAGSKSANSYPPEGLIARSQDDGSDGIIYVALNYRLGAFGWLSGPEFQADGTANVGLYDQRFALEWVQENIAKFGGDPNRVTVFGESAGGGSIMHQITAYGGKNGSAPFQQAIMQSPGFAPIFSSAQEDESFQYFLSFLNVSTLEEARQLPLEALVKANALQAGVSAYGTFGFGPSVDGVFVPDLPGALLLNGSFDKNLKVMVGHNADEGLLFASPFAQTDADYETALTVLLPQIKNYTSVLNYIINDLYPPVFNGSYGYTNNIQRLAATIAEVSFTCNTFDLDKAFGNQTYAYEFSVPPATHGSDIAYTFYDGGSILSSEVAEVLQDYLTSFAMNGSPNEEGVPFFNLYGKNATEENLNITGITSMTDPTANARCDWWQQILPLSNSTSGLTLGAASANASGSTGSGSSTSTSSSASSTASSASPGSKLSQLSLSAVAIAAALLSAQVVLLL